MLLKKNELYAKRVILYADYHVFASLYEYYDAYRTLQYKQNVVTMKKKKNSEDGTPRGVKNILLSL